MKKWWFWGGGLVAIAAVGWTGAWFYGRTLVLERLDTRIAHLRDRGIEITDQGRSVTGFPFAYDVHLDQPAFARPDRGLVADFPWLQAHVGITNPNQILIRFPERFEFGIKQPGSNDAEPQRIEAESTAMSATLTPKSADDMDIRIAAESLLLVHANKAQKNNMALDISGLDTSITTAEPRANIKLGGMTYLLVAEPDAAPPLRIDLSYNDIQSSVTFGQGGLDGFLAMLEGDGKGKAELAVQTGASQSDITFGNAKSPRGGKTTSISGTTAGVITLEDQRISVSTSQRNNVVTLSPAITDSPYYGTVALDNVEIIYDSPIIPTPEPQPWSYRLALNGIEPDAALWKRLDPSNSLPHDPGRFIAETNGTVRLIKEPGLPIFAQLGKLQIQRAEAQGMGARAELHGDIEMLQPINLPVGDLSITLDHAVDLVNTLAANQVIAPVTQQSALLILHSFTRPEENGRRTAVVTFTLQGPLVNGKPLR